MKHPTSTGRPRQGDECAASPTHVRAWLVAIALALLVSSGTVLLAASIGQGDTAPPSELPLVGLLEDERNTIDVFRRAGAGVVFVTNNALRRDFFSVDVTEVPQGTGTGFLWDREGHVVTNFHVLEGGQTFSVTLADGTHREAHVVGVEPRKDLAVLRVDLSGLEVVPLPIGRSDPLVVGQKVLAIGNPFGLDRTVTTGIVSALGREIPTKGGFVIEDVIQTDASINPGNSGGPLLDSAGRVIGVNTAIYSPSGTSAGIGFAIPMDTVARIVPQLIRYGHVRRVGLGVTIVPDYLVDSWGLEGVMVRDVPNGSPAARAGLRSVQVNRRGIPVSADLILEIDGRPIRSLADLSNAMDDREPGDRVRLIVARDGVEKLTLEVELTELER
ncbi:MAG: trypsin-like peptidase domain-containing protein [Spirochaetaceae bacterium]|nr:trypsin-like peptidase domain-containing protein [Myxococcales bacterium]MCB9723588.1 trypsin-like peptidase domain-containing protein [Spirochaetaceae bacterium]HPG26315.1 trypsin-like peptidase domain-containing protein [Myxococcota bacterium]